MLALSYSGSKKDQIYWNLCFARRVLILINSYASKIKSRSDCNEIYNGIKLTSRESPNGENLQPEKYDQTGFTLSQHQSPNLKSPITNL